MFNTKIIKMVLKKCCIHKNNSIGRMVIIMRKLFNSKKAGLKNESTVKFLDSLKSWGFFIVACCVTLFMYIYAHSNNEFVLADGTDSGSTTTPTTHIVTLKYFVDDE